MQFHDSALDLLGSRAKLKILTLLFDQNVPMSERELAAVVGVSHTTVNKVMREFHALNLVSPQRVGNANLWRVNQDSFWYRVLAGVVSDLAQLPSPLDHLKTTIAGTLPRQLVRRAVLFGSVAAGEEAENSDIDLFVLVKDTEDKRGLEPHLDRLSDECLRLYGNRLAPYVLTEGELAERGNLPLLREIEGGITIYP